MTLRAQVGEAVRAARLRRGWTVRDLAPRVEVSFQQVASIETGAQNTTVDRLEKIAAALGEEPVFRWRSDDAALLVVPPHIRPLVERLIRAHDRMPARALDALDLQLQAWEQLPAASERLKLAK